MAEKNQIYEDNDINKAFLTVNVYHNETIMFQGTEACLSSVQAHSITALAEAEKQTQGANSCSISDTESDKFEM